MKHKDKQQLKMVKTEIYGYHYEDCHFSKPRGVLAALEKVDCNCMTISERKERE